MATGGLSNFPLGSAVLQVRVDDQYTRGLTRAKVALNNFAIHAGKAFGAGGLASQFAAGTTALGRFGNRAAQVQTQMAGLAISIKNVTRATVAMNAAMGRGNNMAGFATALKAMSQADAAIVRAHGTAAASQIRAHGRAGAMEIRAIGQNSEGRVRAIGGAISGVIRAFAAPIRAVTAPLAAVVGSVSRLMGSNFALFGAAGAGIGGALTVKSIADQAREAESQMARLQRSTGLEGAELSQLGREFNRFASQTAGVKLGDIFSIGTMAARLGVQGPSLGMFTRDVAKFSAILEDIPAEEATSRIAALVTVFGRGHHEAIRFAAAVNKLDLESTATARDILDVTSRFSGIASILRMAPHQALALATALRQVRVPVETAGTATGQILSRMASRRDQRAFANIAGMPRQSFDQLLGRDPLKALVAVAQGLSRIEKLRGPTEAVRTLDQLHLDGQRVRITLLSLVKALPILDRYLVESAKEWSGLTTLMESFGIRARTADAQIIRMENNIALTARAIGESMLPAIKSLANGISDLMIDIREWVEKNKDIFDSWGIRMARVMSYVGLLWRKFPTVMKLVGLEIREKLEQLAVIGLRFGGQLWENIKVGAENFLVDVDESMKKHATYWGDLIDEGIRNGLLNAAGAIPGLGALLGGIMPKGPVAMPAQRQKMPGFNFADIFKDLPNQNLRKGPLIFRLEKERRVMEADRAARAQADEADDALRRRNLTNRDAHMRAQAAFLGRLGPGGRRVNLDVLRPGPPKNEEARAALEAAEAKRQAAKEAGKSFDRAAEERRKGVLAAHQAEMDRQAKLAAERRFRFDAQVGRMARVGPADEAAGRPLSPLRQRRMAEERARRDLRRAGPGPRRPGFAANQGILGGRRAFNAQMRRDRMNFNRMARGLPPLGEPGGGRLAPREKTQEEKIIDLHQRELLKMEEVKVAVGKVAPDLAKILALWT
jgi:TP901 family phage tail tape measure protein